MQVAWGWLGTSPVQDQGAEGLRAGEHLLAAKLSPRQRWHAGPIYTLQDKGDWVKLNAQQYGFYRVVYPPDMYAKLTNAAKKGPASLSAADLAGLLDDSHKLAVWGTVPITSFLELSTYVSGAAALVGGEGYILTLLLPACCALG